MFPRKRPNYRYPPINSQLNCFHTINTSLSTLSLSPKMNGLIKGIIDVALDHFEKDDEPSDSQSRDERSRSSWAQVVSGDNDEEEKTGNRRHGYNRNQSNQEEEKLGQDDEWQVAGSRPARRPQKQAVHEGYERNDNNVQQQYDKNQSYKKEGQEHEDGWETVGKKPQKPQHKVQKNNWNGYKQPADEQKYSDEIDNSVNTKPSREELSDLSQACNKLWTLDLNRLVPGKDYEIDCGEGKKVYGRDDMAEGCLFTWLGEDVLKKPTFARFCSLLDNYNPNQGSKEVVTNEERQEQAAFIEEISRTAPIKYLHNYLSSKDLVSNDFQDFKRMLTSLWFDLYGRCGAASSSAFEHVFVGEIKQRGEQEVSGFHNWLQFYLEEAKGRVDYQGYIFPRRRGQTPDSETQLLTIQFEWNGVLKSVSSTLVGVSPEFELALYTLCFFVGGEDNYIQLGPYPVNVKCYRLGNNIGSVFPIAEC